MKRIIFLIFLGLIFFAAAAGARGQTIDDLQKLNTDYLFNFAVYGDSQTNPDIHREVATQIEKVNPDFILHTGDFVDDGANIEEWNSFEEVTQNLRARPVRLGLKRNFYPAIGNHDYPLANYLRVFNFDPFSDYEDVYYYSFDYKNFHFVSLNSELDLNRESPQYVWLEKDLKKAKADGKMIVPFMHRHIYSKYWHDEIDFDLQDPLIELFETYGVRITFSGHDHVYERTYPIFEDKVNEKKGITYVISGGGGGIWGNLGTLLEDNFWTAKHARLYHFLYVQATASKIFVNVIDKDGNIYDSFEVKYKNNKKIVSAPASRGGAQIRKFTGEGKLSDTGFFAFSPDFHGGARIASGDVNLDGKDEIAVGAGEGGTPHVRIFNSENKLVDQFFAFSKLYKGGIDVAVGDVNGDGKEEIAVSKLVGGRAEVKIFRDRKGKKLLFKRSVFPNSKYGVTVSLADLDGDRKAELITGSGVGAKPKIRIFEIKEGNLRGKLLKSYKPFSQKLRTGVDVAVGDLDGDGDAEIAASKLSGDLAHVAILEYNNKKALVKKFRAFPVKYRYGANIEMFDVDSDGKEEILVGLGAGDQSKPQIRIFNQYGDLIRKSFLAYDVNFKGGVMVAGANE